VPDGKLVPGKTYTWAVAANDGSRFSGYTAVSTFTVSPNQNLLSEKASFAAPLNDANLHDYDIAYAPATGVMTLKRDGVAVGTFTDPQPLTQGGFVMAMSNLTKVGFDNLTVTANQPANAPPVRSVYYSHSDHLGSSSVVTDSGGAIIQQLDYLPYGEERINEQTPAAGATSFNTKKKYTGKELDTETGLYYYGARYYDSRISRFVSLDPVARDLSQQRLFKEPQRWNTYSYAENNPVEYVDPTGMSGELAGVLLQWSFKIGGATALIDSPAPGPADVVGGAIVVVGSAAALVVSIYDYVNSSPAPAAASSDAVPYGPPNPNVAASPAPQPYGPPKPPKRDGNLNKDDVPKNVRKQVPKEWGEGEPAKGSDEWRWSNPKNPNETVRYSEAKPDSQYPSQQQPYIKQTGPNGQPMDINGKQISPRSGMKPSQTPESHIPADKWQFRR